MYRIGIDLGGTNIAVGVVSEDMKIIGRSNVKTNCPRPTNEIFDDIAKAVNLAIENAGISIKEVSSIGLGTPGSVNKDNGVIEFANNLGFDNVPAKKMLEERIPGVAFYLDNDANCAALGEAIVGCGKGKKSFVAITLGTGVGSGIVFDGKIVTGTNFAAGELGHHVINFEGKQCNCGRKGCWEQYASATALIEQTKAAMLNNKDSKMWNVVNGDISKVDGKTSFDAIELGDAIAKEVFKNYCKFISVGLINIVNALQPDMICVGGGVANQGENLLAPIRELMVKERYSIHASKQTELCVAQLGNDAGIIGSALLDE